MRATDPELEALRDQLAGAQDAARRLAREAAAVAGRRPPPAGWASAPQSPEGMAGSELSALVDLAEKLRSAIPAELWKRLVAALRELLLVLRALLDLGLARLEEQHEPPPEVEDIPIL